jgi:nucleotide-binding universal stress UspA family protein
MKVVAPLLFVRAEAIMDLKRILVAIDAPHGRDAAFERALTLAHSSGAELYLLHAVPANQPFSFRAAYRMARMEEMRSRAEAAGVAVQTVEQHGDPAQIIELHANARAVDLIVMGGEPRSGWHGHRSFVAERVIRRTSVPTLVVPSDAVETPASFRNVLVAVDLSLGSKDVVSGAIGLSADEADRLTVMHTVTGLEAADAVHGRARWMVPEYRSHVMNDARRTLDTLVTAVPAGIGTQVQVSTGSAARRILEHAAAVNADLVVVGRSRGFKLLGSTALRVVRRNNRALLVVPSASQRRVARSGRAA